MSQDFRFGLLANNDYTPNRFHWSRLLLFLGLRGIVRVKMASFDPLEMPPSSGSSAQNGLRGWHDS